jgi:hypothetical protein
MMYNVMYIRGSEDAMGRMVRKQFYITEEQDRFLKRKARSLGVTEAEVARRGIAWAGQPGTAFKPDLKAWEALKKDMAERAKIDAPQTGRTWTRDDLYEERMRKVARR